uniref:Uncharacterized protein n=1 Tax=Pinctada fucata TaxID=50426 RepID=A0A194AJT2_PINFU
MATADITDEDIKQVCEKLKECVVAAKGGGKLTAEEKTQLNNKACKKMVTDTGLPPKCSQGFDIAFSAVKKSKPGIVNLSKHDEVRDLLDRCAKEYATVQKGKDKKPVTDDEKREYKVKLCDAIKNATFNAQSKAEPTNKKASDATARLTDTKKYTGAHKERFDAEGKGKGAEGRTGQS